MKIKRQTHLVAFGAPITVYVGDHKKISLKNGDQIEYHIQGDYVDLSLKHSKQPPKRATNSDCLIISDNPLNLFLFWAGIVLIFVSHLFLNFNSHLLYWLTLIGLISSLTSYFLPRFRWINQAK